MRWSEFKSDWVYYAREAILRVLAISLIVFIFIVMPILLGYRCYKAYNPSDLVKVAIENTPPDADFICLVAEADNEPLALDWYLGGGIINPPSTTPASRGSYGRRYVLKGGPAAQAMHDVQWPPADRYGVLMRDKAGVWKVYWFTGEDAQVRSGRWKVKLPEKERAETPSQDFLNKVGVEQPR